MIEDMNARKLGAHTQRGHIYSCKRFAAFLKRSPDTATAEDIRRFQVHLADTGMSICNRNRIMTGVRFFFRVTLRRLDLAAEIYHMREPEKLPLVMSKDEMKRLLAVAGSLKARIMLSLGYARPFSLAAHHSQSVFGAPSARHNQRASSTPARPNPHRACCTAGCPTHRDFVPWRFSDAGHSARDWHRHAGVRETCTRHEIAAR
jgi:hypothetical protein